jgi:hypothetical protein
LIKKTNKIEAHAPHSTGKLLVWVFERTLDDYSNVDLFNWFPSSTILDVNIEPRQVILLLKKIKYNHFNKKQRHLTGEPYAHILDLPSRRIYLISRKKEVNFKKNIIFNIMIL